VVAGGVRVAEHHDRGAPRGVHPLGAVERGEERIERAGRNRERGRRRRGRVGADRRLDAAIVRRFF
jgi:hypothetical protein